MTKTCRVIRKKTKIITHEKNFAKSTVTQNLGNLFR